MKHPITGIEMCPWCRKEGEVGEHSCYDAIEALTLENQRLRCQIQAMEENHAYDICETLERMEME